MSVPGATQVEASTNPEQVPLEMHLVAHGRGVTARSGDAWLGAVPDGRDGNAEVGAGATSVTCLPTTPFCGGNGTRTARVRGTGLFAPAAGEDCGILARGLAQLFCPTCHERYVVAWSCKGRGFCPGCGGRRMNAGALTLVDHVLPQVPLRQFVLTVPFLLRFPLAFDGKLLGQVVRIFIDTVIT